jgi:hypothetical protein
MSSSASEQVKGFAKKILLKKLLPQNVLYLKHRMLETLGREPVIVYTMGKVGSSTVFHAFQKQHFFSLVYHVHHLTDEAYQSAVKRYEKNDLNLSGKVSLLTLMKGNSQHMSASQILKRPPVVNSKRKWNVITLVRDPFSTFLSHLFQNPKLTRPFLLGRDGLLDKNKVERYISKTFLNFKTGEDFISNWFDREFLKFTGIDLYQHPFDAEVGYSIIQEERFNIVVVSLQSLDRNLPVIIKKITNSNQEIPLKRRNVRAKNDKTGFYRFLKSEIRVPREGLEKFYSTKYARHFFTAEFRNSMINKWAGDKRRSLKRIKKV